jgi:hypothetical protein
MIFETRMKLPAIPKLWQGDLRHLERDVAGVSDDPRADLDQLFLEGRQRPVLDRHRRRQRAQEVAEVRGEGVKLKVHGVGGERPARQLGWPKLAFRRRDAGVGCPEILK